MMRHPVRPGIRPRTEALSILSGVLAFLFLGSVHRLYGQDQERERAALAGPAERLDEMRELVRSLRALKIEKGQHVPVALRPEPLQRWNDPTREFSDGSLWLWNISGRPVAAVAVELYPHQKTGWSWSYEFVSLSTGPVEVEGDGFDFVWTDLPAPRPDGKLLWTPKTPGIAFRDLPGAATPGQTEAERLRQMKSLAGRFSATEFFQDKNYTLRPLPHPAHRYAVSSDGIVDGALFFFANGTNPEVMVFIEAQGRRPDDATWRYAIARLSRAGSTVRLDQKEVWTRPFADRPRPDETYFIARKLRTPATQVPRSGTGDKP